MVEHGRDYLSAAEYQRCLKDAERCYFLFLAKCACSLRGVSGEFWEFHRKGLASINYSLDWRHLGRWLPRALIEKTWEAFLATWDRSSRVIQDRDVESSVKA